MPDLKRFSWKVAIGALVLLVAALRPPTAEARLVSSWTPERIVDKAELLVVGEVYEVTELTRVAKEMTRWRIPLLRMNANIRVKRSFAMSGEHEIREAEPITLAYYAIDWKNCRGIANGPQFPDLSSGDVFVFPLKKASPQQGDSWELIDEEGFGLLTPAVTEQLRHHSEVKTGIDFLRSELTGAFSKGKYETVFKAAQYLSHLHNWAKQFEETYKLIEKHVGDDEDRWLSIGAASYCAMGVPRPKIPDLLKSEEHRRLQANLAAKALRRIDGKGLDDRLIAKSIKHSSVHTWGTAVTIAVNYSRHPAAMRMLRKALEDGMPEAVYIAQYIIKEKDHPLSAAAVDAAAKVLIQPGTPDFSGFRAACELIRDYGDEQAFGLLLDDIRKCQRTDRQRYRKLWQSCAYAKSQRLIPICRIVIGDQASFSGDKRFCDVAAFELQRVTGEDFGLASEQGADDREKAIRRAREYLNQ